MISLSEIDTTSKRATKAIGFSWGIAEEVGKNMRLLEQFGLSGVKNLNEYFEDYKKKRYKKENLISEKNENQKIPYCPIIFGTNFIDQITFLEKINQIEINNLGFPILFLPFVSRASEIIGKKIYLQIDDRQFLLNLNQSIYSNYLKSEIIENFKISKINFIQNKNTFNEIEWKQLYQLSENTFVEERDSLKVEGAGAGLTDND